MDRSDFADTKSRNNFYLPASYRGDTFDGTELDICDDANIRSIGSQAVTEIPVSAVQCVSGSCAAAPRSSFWRGWHPVPCPNKNTRKSMVGVTGFEPATPTSRILSSGVQPRSQKSKIPCETSIIHARGVLVRASEFAHFQLNL